MISAEIYASMRRVAFSTQSIAGRAVSDEEEGKIVESGAPYPHIGEHSSDFGDEARDFGMLQDSSPGVTSWFVSSTWACQQLPVVAENWT